MRKKVSFQIYERAIDRVIKKTKGQPIEDVFAALLDEASKYDIADNFTPRRRRGNATKLADKK